jgi:hypothetical protein
LQLSAYSSVFPIPRHFLRLALSSLYFKMSHSSVLHDAPGDDDDSHSTDTSESDADSAAGQHAPRKFLSSANGDCMRTYVAAGRPATEMRVCACRKQSCPRALFQRLTRVPLMIRLLMPLMGTSCFANLLAREALTRTDCWLRFEARTTSAPTCSASPLRTSRTPEACNRALRRVAETFAMRTTTLMRHPRLAAILVP